MALPYDQIIQALDEYLDPVLSTRRTSAGPARKLIPLPLEQQEFALHWTNIIRKSNAEMAYQFVSHAPLALKLMGTEGTREWLLNAMDVYDKEGLYPGSAAFENIEGFSRQFRLKHVTVTLEQVKNVLGKFICGLTGRELKIETADSSFTDTETLYLPAAINQFNDRQQNYRLYKVLAVHLWAQTWFGTFKRPHPDAPHLRQRIATFAEPHRALKLFNLLETFRLNACIHRELPGLAKEMLTLADATTVHDNTWRHLIEKLESVDATVQDTLDATARLYELPAPWPGAFVYQGGFDLDASENTIENRIQLEKNELQTALSEMLEGPMADTEPNQSGEDQTSVEMAHDGQNTADTTQLSLDGQPRPLPPELRSLLSSILQDLENIPEEWLVADAQDRNRNVDGKPPEVMPMEKVSSQKNDTFVYNEWDFRRQTYRKNWCVLREQDTLPIYDDFTDKTVHKYHHLINDIRRHFEALRGEEKILKAQPGGDNIDLDALITAYADMQTGVEMTDRLYTRLQKVDRDLAVIFMVDVSGSTKGWINEAEKESLILLCQALEVLGDQYAIYGFSGMTRNRCDIYRVKTFEQTYNREVRARISGLKPQDYTRMGVTIRHLTAILNRVEARTRIMITLSDGKPDDYDGYRGDYGIEDTRQALFEARHVGIHPFCITIDTEASDYLPHMYGPASFVVLDEVRKLPLKVADIYRRLTT